MGQVATHDFIYYDDDWYVTDNRHVQAGITMPNVVWAFTTTSAWNWHPLTWLSHMLDVSLFGLHPGGHHLISLLLHTGNVLLLFFFLDRTTRAPWRSGFVAALFAIHPLHVESVAWVAERKDVLSTFFGMVSLLAYARYAEAPSAPKYLAVLSTYALSLMAKPMLVTLPFVFLLLDYWPLDRIPRQPGPGHLAKGLLKTIPEKLPFLALAAASSAVTYLAQGGMVRSLDHFPIRVRLENAAVSYVQYMIDTIWPSGLVIFYPHPGAAISRWAAAASALVLVALSTLAVRFSPKRRYLPVGWLWYLGTLVPVIGFVQVGSQARADRYSYFPLIGLFILITWALSEMAKGRPQRKSLLAASACVVLGVLMVLSFAQVSRWKDNTTLFEYTLKIMPDNYLAHHNLGLALSKQGRLEEAIAHYNRALAIKPNFDYAHNSLGAALAESGRVDEAIAQFSEAIEFSPTFEPAEYNLGNALTGQG